MKTMAALIVTSFMELVTTTGSKASTQSTPIPCSVDHDIRWSHKVYERVCVDHNQRIADWKYENCSVVDVGVPQLVTRMDSNGVVYTREITPRIFKETCPPTPKTEDFVLWNCHLTSRLELARNSFCADIEESPGVY